MKRNTKVSIKLKYPISPIVKVKMYDEQEKVLGLVKDKVQVVITLPNICDFSSELNQTMKTVSNKDECYIVTSSPKESVNKIIEQYDLAKSSISLDFKNFAKVFDLNTPQNNLKKSLMVIDKNCQIVHKDIL
ncbi:MAG: hypothetical protein ACJAWW_002541 [Sulfurimonas sp.]|jgi:hypothetical protein